MRYLFSVILCLWPLWTMAQDWEDRQVFQGTDASRTLRILSSTDTSFFEPIIASFLAKTPELSVEYLVIGTAEIDQRFRQAPDRYDVVISSAMDLQLKLANDGFARRLGGVAHPDWAQWRESLFAFTSEPAAIVVNRAAFEGQALPRTRQELIQALRARPDVFRGRLGTYDVRDSGLGYLFATQDARASETYWRLMEVMGSLGTRLYCCSGDMIDDLSDGTIAVAYNVLGSYASARQQTDGRIAVILPSDFPTTMMRTGFVSSQAQHPQDAARFVRHLISLQSDPVSKDSLPLPPLSTDSAGQSAIALEPALLTYLDGLKRQTFIKEWVSAIVQP
ncbi:ABC transporter substrate-binding protein [Seohaeicola saemankumensis]|nr:ABC transporter substrate-binding protein [Seohaeicola saemankumensis]MCA0870641.1 ABC transporter substrate-binding protein [Seohaeicola saemankumensis]